MSVSVSYVACSSRHIQCMIATCMYTIQCYRGINTVDSRHVFLHMDVARNLGKGCSEVVYGKPLNNDIIINLST